MPKKLLNNYKLLFRYAKNGDLNNIKYLYEMKIDLTTHNDTAICLAAKKGHLKIVKFLHTIGANIQAQNNHAIRLSSENGHLEVVKYLVENSVNVTALNNYAICQASKNGHLEVVKYLIQTDADVFTKNYIFMDWILRQNDLQIIQYLIDNDVDLSMNNYYLLFNAMKMRNQKMINLIIYSYENYNDLLYILEYHYHIEYPICNLNTINILEILMWSVKINCVKYFDDWYNHDIKFIDKNNDADYFYHFIFNHQNNFACYHKNTKHLKNKYIDLKTILLTRQINFI